MEESVLISKPLETLSLSDEFKAMAKENKFATLQTLLKTPMHEFPHLPQSGYRMVRELVNFANANGIGHLVKD